MGKINPYIMWFYLLCISLSVLFWLLDVKDVKKMEEALNYLKFTSLMPMLSAIVSYVPEGMHSKKRIMRLRYFINSRSFPKFMFFWLIVFISNMAVLLLSAIKDLPERAITSLNLAVIGATVVFVVITFILLLRLITMPNRRGQDE